MEEERATVAFPTFELVWLGVLEHPRFAEADLGALRVVVNVGVPERLMAMQGMLPGAALVSCLGMTESTGSICLGSPTDPVEQRTTTSGRPMPGVELRIIDEATGEECAAGAAGELQFRGINDFDGYFRDPENTAAIHTDDGWIRTGDLAVVESSGLAQYRGRLKEMLKVGGENASASEIEGFLLTHPGVAVAAVVPAPDARYGEVPAAFIQSAPGTEVDEEALIQFCLGQIATFKVPRYVRFVDEFPTTASEKIRKVELRERIEEELRNRGITEAPKLTIPQG
jgi:fatty-acyl-CoA synthase